MTFPLHFCSTGSELTVATLENELWSVASKWETLGRKLGLPEGSLKNIAADFPLGRGASKRRLNAVLDDWCNNVTDGSWSNIVCALKEKDESILARGIEKKYYRPDQGSYTVLVYVCVTNLTGCCVSCVLTCSGVLVFPYYLAYNHRTRNALTNAYHQQFSHT